MLGFVTDGGELSISANQATTNQDALDVGFSIAYQQTSACTVGSTITASG